MDTQISTKDVVRQVLSFAATVLIFQYVFPIISGITIAGGWAAAAGLAFVHSLIVVMGAIAIALVLYATGVLSKELVSDLNTKGLDTKQKIFMIVPSAALTAGSLLSLSWLFPDWFQVSGWEPALIATAVLLVYGQVWNFLWKQLG